jgi:flagellar FliL protein
MANAAATADEKPAAAPSGGMPIKLVMMIVAAALLVGLGGAFAYFKLFAAHPEEPKAEAAASEKPGHGEAKESKEAKGPGTIMDIDPFVVNLADAGEVRYLKVTLKLELERPEIQAEITARTPQVRDAILILLSSKDSASVHSTQGKLQLRDELTNRINTTLPKGGVRTMYFTEFVVQ